MTKQIYQGLFLATLLSLSCNIAVAQDSPAEQQDIAIYDNGKLVIPRVDTTTQPGMFRNGVLEYDKTVDAWRLKEYKSTPQGQIFSALPGGSVEVIVVDSTPIQVFLKVHGSFSAICGNDHAVYQRLEDNHFSVVIHRGTSVACYSAATEFEKIVPLEVFGLPAGDYTFSVNDEKSGSFSLSRNNVL